METYIAEPISSDVRTPLTQHFQDVYSELKGIAAREHRKFFNANTLNTSALVNEAYIKLKSQKPVQFQNRSHFLAVSATAMRHILVNYLEQKNALKRGGNASPVTLNTCVGEEIDEIGILEIHDALNKLEVLDHKLAALVELRFFAGMTEVEVATYQGTSTRTVRRNWVKARALLQCLLSGKEKMSC